MPPLGAHITTQNIDPHELSPRSRCYQQQYVRIGSVDPEPMCMCLLMMFHLKKGTKRCVVLPEFAPSLQSSHASVRNTETLTSSVDQVRAAEWRIASSLARNQQYKALREIGRRCGFAGLSVEPFVCRDRSSVRKTETLTSSHNKVRLAQ